MSEVTLPDQGRIAGIDYGTVRIGIAMCDDRQSISSPYEQYSPRTKPQDAQYFQSLAQDERLVGWVVGLPIHLSGEESQKSLEAREFAKWLGETTNLPVVLFDERFTTSMARDVLEQAGLTKKKRKKRLDQLAAQILLSAFLESSRRQTGNESLDDRRL